MSAAALKAAALCILWGIIWAGAYSGLLPYLTTRVTTSHPYLLPFSLHAVFILGTACIVYALVRKYVRQDAADQYRRLFFDHPVPMWIYRWGTLQFLAVNDAALRKYGYTREQWLKLSILDIRHPSTVNDVLEDVRKTNKEQAYRGVWQHQRSNGELFPVELYAHPTRFAGHDARLVMALDVEAEIRASITGNEFGTRYELLSQVTPDYIYYWDILSGYVTRNHGPRTMFGYTDADVRPDRFWWKERVHPGDVDIHIRSLRQAFRDQADLWEAEYRFRCADGSYKHVHDRARILYENGQPVRMIGAVQDISERKAFITQLQAHNDLLLEVARMNSHELRKPVADILGIMALADFGADDPVLSREMLDMLRQSTQELDALLHKVQDKLHAVQAL
ncbi:PAS domain-containing protein [Chitinophaga lutea]